MSATRTIVVFDGHCGVCTRIVCWIQRLDRRGRLRCIPSQFPGVLDEFALTPRDADASVWAIQRGRKRAGAAACALIIDTLLPFDTAQTLYRLPGIRRAADAVYRWVADHRGRFPGVRPRCAQHPEDCGSGAR